MTLQLRAKDEEIALLRQKMDELTDCRSTEKAGQTAALRVRQSVLRRCHTENDLAILIVGVLNSSRARFASCRLSGSWKKETLLPPWFGPSFLQCLGLPQRGEVQTKGRVLTNPVDIFLSS